MRYQIMDTVLDWSSVFVLIFLCTWITVALSSRLGRWWREGRAEIQVEEVEHTDPIVLEAKRTNLWGRR